jgi:iron complex outermembrane receptor protein
MNLAPSLFQIHPRRAGSPPAGRDRRTAIFLLASLTVWVGSATAQLQPALPSPSTLGALTVEQLMDIEVTSVSKRPEKLSTAASAVQVITSDDIHRSGATSIPEALRLTSNLEVAQIDARQWAITARGFNNVFADKMLVLIDGRSVYTPLYAGVYWDVQDTLLEDVDRIEVISGPGATQWGANAVNGVINITSKNARDTQGGLITFGGGSELRDAASIRYGGEAAPGVYYRIYGKYFDRGDTLRPSGLNGDDAWRMGQGGFRVDWNAAAGNVVTVQGDIYNGTATRAGPDNTGMSGGNLLGRWSRALAENSDFRLQVYYDYTHRSIPRSFTQSLHTFDVDFQHRFPLWNKHDIVWGFGYRLVDDDVINTPANAFLPPSVIHQWFNVFLQDEVALAGDRLHLTLGSKLEHNDYTGYEPEPSMRASWSLTKTQTVWTAISRAVRTPSRIDRDLFSPATPPYRIAGGPDVVSERLLAYELGYRIQVDPHLSLSLATFYNDYHDLRSLEPLSPPAAFPVVINSGLNGYSAGAELTAEWQATPTWRLRAGYTQLHVSSAPQPGRPDRASGRNVANDPTHQLLLRSLWDLSPTWDFDATLRSISSIANQRVPGYTELDLRLGWQATAALQFSLSGQNLLHAHHAEFNPPGSRREIPRSVYAKATWRF